MTIKIVEEKKCNNVEIRPQRNSIAESRLYDDG